MIDWKPAPCSYYLTLINVIILAITLMVAAGNIRSLDKRVTTLEEQVKKWLN